MDSLQTIFYALTIVLFVSAIGFVRTVWFISIGYAASVVVLGLTVSYIYISELSILKFLQLGILLFWGIRLGFFLFQRERNQIYKQRVKDQTDPSQQQPIYIKFAIWIGVSILYVCMFSPAYFAIKNDGINSLLLSMFGVVIMFLGITIEGIADAQKSNFKKKYPHQFCYVGLFKWVRYPNYLGEILVWLGNFICAIYFMNQWWQWVMALFGLVCIILIMMGSTKRLEKKQAHSYGTNPEFVNYEKTVPVLFPWLPIYSLQKVKVYLE